MRKFVRQNSLGLFCGVIFLLALVGQALAGWKQFNDEQLAESLSQISVPQYLTSASFATDVAENWQSEYLQFLLYILATVWLLQRGSPESKELDRAGRESARDQKIGEHATTSSPKWARAGGLRTAVYSWSLGIVMGLVFLLSWFAQSLAGWAAFNETRLQRLQDPLSWGGYLLNADFWARSLQNWQSEFLAVGSMAVFSIYLRNGARRRASL
jgi:Domain of unknown function (DUF6766)